MAEMKHPKVVVEQAKAEEALGYEESASADAAAQEKAAHEPDAGAVEVAEGAPEVDPDAQRAGDGVAESAVAAPRLVVEGAGDSQVADEPAAAKQEQEAGDVTAEDVSPSEPPVETVPPSSPEMAAAPMLSPWLHRHFPGHEHAVVGCLLGLIFALVVLFAGISRALFIAACMAAGTLVGMYLDGDRRVKGAVRELSGKKQ